MSAAILTLLDRHGRCFPSIAGSGPDWCAGCDWTGYDHRAHVAAVLDAAKADEVRAAAEKAWDEGYERRADAVQSFLPRGKGVAFHLTPPNPYRVDKETTECATSDAGSQDARGASSTTPQVVESFDAPAVAALNVGAEESTDG